MRVTERLLTCACQGPITPPKLCVSASLDDLMSCGQTALRTIQEALPAAQMRYVFDAVAAKCCMSYPRISAQHILHFLIALMGS